MAKEAGGNGIRSNEQADASQPQTVTARCPNADCGRVFTVQARYAGRRGKCTACGTAVVVPAATAPTATPQPVRVPNEKAVEPTVTKRTSPEPSTPDITEVRIGCIGRGNAGKTAIFHAIGESVVGDYLPSGLHIDAADPREVARLIRETEEAERLLHQSGLPPTIRMSQTQYRVFDGDESRIAIRMREVIGQILTHTLPDSAAEYQARYDEYLHDLVDAHVLWTVVPCPPPRPSAQDCRKYANDLRITVAYLREALRQRSRERPAAVAIVLSKIDTLFSDADRTRHELNDATLRDALGPIINLVVNSAAVSEAAIIPVTAFGFGNAVLGQGTERAGSTDEPFGTEPVWLLPEGSGPRPYNLKTLFVWSLLLGLYTQAGTGIESRPGVREVFRRLSEDLGTVRPWLMPVKRRAEGV